MPKIFPRADGPQPQSGGRRRSRRRRLVIVAGGVAAGVLLLGVGVVGLFVAVYGFDTNVSKRDSDHGTQVERIALTDFDVTPGTLVVDRGTHLVLDVVNEGDEVHDLALEDGRLRTRMLEPGQSQRLDLGHVTGELVCTVPLHKSLGMTLDVRVANAAEQPHSAAHQPKRKKGTRS
jgi:nitrite reductase (NO-forming)